LDITIAGSHLNGEEAAYSITPACMANRITPAVLIRETKHLVIARNLFLNRETTTVLLLGLGVVVFLFLPNRDRMAFEAVQIGMPQETLVQTLTGLEPTVTRHGDEEIRTWRDRVKFPLRKYQVTLRGGKVTTKRVLP
jgi:hypothetical protein